MSSPEIQIKTGLETRTVVPGHILRGGSPSAYDRVLATQFGAHAAQLLKKEKFGYTVAMVDGKITENPLGRIENALPASARRIQACATLSMS